MSVPPGALNTNRRAILTRLQMAGQLEAKARAEVDRLMELAWCQGATDRDIAAALAMTHDAARMRRHRAGLRAGKPRGRPPWGGTPDAPGG